MIIDSRARRRLPRLPKLTDHKQALNLQHPRKSTISLREISRPTLRILQLFQKGLERNQINILSQNKITALAQLVSILVCGLKLIEFIEQCTDL